MTNDTKIAEEIIDYLQEHPEAADTLEGITTWWVQSQTVRESVDTVYQALKELKAAGLVIERRDADGKTLYFLSCS
jgi:Fe2+ or Zn2+ uptake regulation protein